jgi:hypothetical protein
MGQPGRDGKRGMAAQRSHPNRVTRTGRGVEADAGTKHPAGASHTMARVSTTPLARMRNLFPVGSRGDGERGRPSVGVVEGCLGITVLKDSTIRGWGAMGQPGLPS